MGPGIRVDVPALLAASRLRVMTTGLSAVRPHRPFRHRQRCARKGSIRRAVRTIAGRPPTRTPRRGHRPRAAAPVVLQPQRDPCAGHRSRGRLVPAPPGKGGSMPTEAKRATVAELTEASPGSSRRSWPTTAASRSSEISGRAARAARARASAITWSRTGWRASRPSRPGRGAGGLLIGPTAVALGGGDEAALAKGVLDALRPFPRSSSGARPSAAPPSPPTRSPGWPRCRRVTCSWASWPAASRRR